MGNTSGRNGGWPADAFLERLTEAHSHYSPENRELVQEVVTAMLATMNGDLSGAETSLLGEVEALGRTMAAAKAEIAALRVDDRSFQHVTGSRHTGGALG
jgi:chemotaxis protein CheZ